MPIAVVVFVPVPYDDVPMPAVMNGVAAGFLRLSRRHVAVAPANFLAVVRAWRRRPVMSQYDAPVVTIMIVMATSAVAIMVAVPMAVMVSYIIAVAVLVSMAFGKRRSAKSQ